MAAPKLDDVQQQVTDLKAELGPLKVEAEQAKKDRKSLQLAEQKLAVAKVERRAAMNRATELEQLLRVRESTISNLEAKINEIGPKAEFANQVAAFLKQYS